MCHGLSKREESIDLLQKFSCCQLVVGILCFLLMLQSVGLWYVVDAIPGHTHLLIANKLDLNEVLQKQ